MVNNQDKKEIKLWDVVPGYDLNEEVDLKVIPSWRQSVSPTSAYTYFVSPSDDATNRFASPSRNQNSEAIGTYQSAPSSASPIFLGNLRDRGGALPSS